MNHDPASKRVLTDDLYTSSAASSNPLSMYTPPDLAAALRNVGARARKHVTEGYTTERYSASAPSRLPLSRATSTGGDIFRSANDTLREVFSGAAAPQIPSHIMAPSKKRSLEEADVGTYEAAIDEDGDGAMSLDPTNDFPTTGLDVGGARNRPMKPLRKPRRTFGKAQSLPTDAFMFSGGSMQQSETRSGLAPVTERLPDTDEDDWSTANIGDSQTPFEPMIL
ncbi:hypothetical protein HGRIS_009987 [Hohenbuehelia grisea]|uniref:DASH complex subunit ASK1 n=1 Tax=Hohenbuehelia grisea TaxID=104357 RepID=A0ABR3J396_9AGAR